MTLGTSLAEIDLPAGQYNTVSYFSSRGPSLTASTPITSATPLSLLKPEAMGVGDPVYMATETYDSDGVMWDPSGYTAQSGTSFATPMLAGAAALVNAEESRVHARAIEVGRRRIRRPSQIITDPNDGTGGTGT